jgi:hypothetical protein
MGRNPDAVYWGQNEIQESAWLADEITSGSF